MFSIPSLVILDLGFVFFVIIADLVIWNVWLYRQKLDVRVFFVAADVLGSAGGARSDHPRAWCIMHTEWRRAQETATQQFLGEMEVFFPARRTQSRPGYKTIRPGAMTCKWWSVYAHISVLSECMCVRVCEWLSVCVCLYLRAKPLS